MLGSLDLEELYETAPCGLLTLALDGTVQRANGTFCQWVGRSREELYAGKHFQDLLTIGSKLFHQTHWMPLLQLQGSVAEVQLDLAHRDGQAISALVNARMRAESAEAAGRIDVAVFLAVDRRKYERELLLARRQAEELLASERLAQRARERAEARLRLALESANLLTWHVELPAGAAIYEPRVALLLGKAEAAEVTPDVYTRCIHEADRAREREVFAAAIDPEQRAPYSLEYRLAGFDGVERVVRSSGRAFFDEGSGHAVAFSGVLEDVTAVKAQEREAAQRAALGEQLVGIVSHDLRNPLNVVILGTHLLRSTESSPADARAITRIASAAERASRLVTDLLDFTQARLGGGLRVSPREVDLHDEVAAAVDEIRLAWPGRMIQMRTHGCGLGRADSDRLQQVLGNLANNALTYGKPDEPITVTASVDAGAMEIRVHNYGTPIPDELLSHIFEPLRRGEHSIKLGSRSVGLGLYIVHEIAAAHGGRVSVTSTEAEGTEFLFSIPSQG